MSDSIDPNSDLGTLLNYLISSAEYNYDICDFGNTTEVQISCGVQSIAKFIFSHAGAWERKSFYVNKKNHLELYFLLDNKAEPLKDDQIFLFKDFFSGYKINFGSKYGLHKEWQRAYIYEGCEYLALVKFENDKLYSFKVNGWATKEFANIVKEFESKVRKAGKFIPQPQEEKEVKTHAMVNALYEGLKAVQVKFNESGKSYTYKTFMDLEVGDKVIVESPHEGYVVVDVVGTDCTQLETGHRYKWIVQKLDDTDYLAQNEKEDKAIAEMNKMVMANKRTEALAEIEKALGGKNELNRISQNLNKIES